MSLYLRFIKGTVMLSETLAPLDNPVWYALQEHQRHFRMPYQSMAFFTPDVCPFGGFLNTCSPAEITDYARQTSHFFVVGDRPCFEDTVTLHNELVCDQMVLQHPVPVTITEPIIMLEEAHKDDLIRLVNLVQPGYFKENTFSMGTYYGIYRDNRLVAVTGERMKMNAFTEISAVITHPEHTGRGYAGQLVSHTCSRILAEGKTPYLHVASSNERAVKLYERLGFAYRRKMSFWNLIGTTATQANAVR